MDKKLIGEYVKSVREARGLRQTELAEMCGCASSAISQIESGLRLPTLRTVYNISKALRVTIEDIVEQVPYGIVPFPRKPLNK